jgi:hypothetical protein
MALALTGTTEGSAFKVAPICVTLAAAGRTANVEFTNHRTTPIPREELKNATLFKMMAGVNMQHVTYRGAGPALTDLIAGQVHLMFDNLPSSIGHIRAGALHRCLDGTMYVSRLDVCRSDHLAPLQGRRARRVRRRRAAGSREADRAQGRDATMLGVPLMREGIPIGAVPGTPLLL